MATAEIADGSDLGQLAANGMQVKMLQTALNRSATNLDTVPKLILSVLLQSAWRDYVFPDNPAVRYRWSTVDFRKFIESPRPAGCQSTIPLLRKILAETDVADAFEEAIRGERGGSNNPYGCVGKPEPEINRNIVTVDSSEADSDPVVIPLPSGTGKPRQRDYSRESKQGNSVGYRLRRLARERPDLLERVKTGELTPNGASILAGFYIKEVGIPMEPRAAARRLVRHFNADQIEELIRCLQEAVL